MDDEGIYRSKSGGSGQSKAIIQLFEKMNYEVFDLRAATPILSMTFQVRV